MQLPGNKLLLSKGVFPGSLMFQKLSEADVSDLPR